MNRSDLDTYIVRARAAGTEVELLDPALLAERVEELARGENALSAVVAGFEERPELRAPILEGLARAGCALLPTGEASRAELGITLCEALLADTGTLVLPSGSDGRLAASLLPRVHVAVGNAGGLRSGMGEYLAAMAGRMPARLVLVTGPSRTGDIEATMTKCVHGPGRVVHLLLG